MRLNFETNSTTCSSPVGGIVCKCPASSLPCLVVINWKINKLRSSECFIIKTGLSFRVFTWKEFIRALRNVSYCWLFVGYICNVSLLSVCKLVSLLMLRVTLLILVTVTDKMVLVSIRKCLNSIKWYKNTPQT